MDFKRYPDGAVFNGDCLPLMKQVQPESIDLILTDPPYGVNFKNEFYDDSKESVLGASRVPMCESRYPASCLMEDVFAILYRTIMSL